MHCDEVTDASKTAVYLLFCVLLPAVPVSGDQHHGVCANQCQHWQTRGFRPAEEYGWLSQMLGAKYAMLISQRCTAKLVLQQ